ncbi:MAG: glycosyltransferase family 39 protein [Armatimonadota bacterium]
MGIRATDTQENAPEAGERSGPRSGYFLAACLAGYLALAATYGLVLPLGHAPDEPAHFAYVLFVAQHARLPHYYADAVGYESYQAPLYYTLSAAVCKLAMVAAERLGAGPPPKPPQHLLDAADPAAPLPPEVRRHPWVPEGQHRLMFAAWREALSLTPAQRAGWLAVRLFTALLGALGIVLAWRIVAVLFPQRAWLATSVAAMMSFLPMYAHICAAVGNDAPTVVVVGLSLLLTVLVLRDGPQPRRVALLGLSLGLGMLTKDSANVTIPVALLALAAAAGRRYEPPAADSLLLSLARRIAALRWGLIAKRAALMLGVMALVAGWWFVRNWRLYHELIHYPANPQTQLPWDYYLMFPGHLGLALGLSLPMTFRNFWGNFAWTNIALAPWVYWALLAVSLAPLPGLALLVADGRAGRLGWSAFEHAGFRALMLALVLMALAVTGHALFIGIGGGSQGRYYFPMLSALGLLAGLGLGRLLPEPARPKLPWAIAGALLAFNLYCLLGVVVPFYRALGV